MDYKMLINNALEVRKLAYAPYSKFLVGTSLITENGKIFNGCNIENVSYTMGLCAERVAIFKAVSDGERNLSAICIVGGLNENPTNFCYPCGACIQVMNEFCTQDFEIVLFNGKDIKVHTLGELSPYNFSEIK